MQLLSYMGFWHANSSAVITKEDETAWLYHLI